MVEKTNQLVEHFFRHQSGQMVSTLVRSFGLRHFDLVEDMVQAALADALRAWKIKGAPQNPGAWIYRVARNRIIDSLRRQKNFSDKSPFFAKHESSAAEPNADPFDPSDLQDDLLRMIFACSHPSLPADSKIPLILKTLCGFNEREIGRGLLLTEETVRKRIYRAKQSMIEQGISLEIPVTSELRQRIDTVHNVLYLMFNEGYGSTNADQAIRQDVCEEAARLCYLLTESESCHCRDTEALLALMLFHACRFQARIDQEGALVLLEDQDRALWDRKLMSKAFEYLHRASVDCVPGSYHFEAAIAMNHCKAARFEDTNWDAIVQLYDRLIRHRSSPIYRLNRAIAIAQRDGPEAGIRLLDEIRNEPHLLRSHLLESSYGEFYRMSGHLEQAVKYFEKAIDKAQSPHDRKLLVRRIEQCRAGNNGQARVE